MSPLRTLTTLVLYLSLVVALVHAHEDVLEQRGHHNHNMKRIMRKRGPLPQDGFGGLVVPPTTTSTTTGAQSTTSASTASQASSTTTNSKLLSSSASSSASASQKSASSSSSVSASSVSSPPQITSSSASSVSTVVVPGVTHTSSVAATESIVPDQQGNTAQAKSTTLTVLIAIVASVGGIFILWTIFRKWKLSSSKEFDRRLNPIDWQPTTGDDDQIPGHARRNSAGSFHSSGHGHGGAGLSRTLSNHSNSNPFDDFDHPQQTAPVGGYADLARGPSPTQMQEHSQHGPSFNQGVGPVPLHHQGGY